MLKKLYTIIILAFVAMAAYGEDLIISPKLEMGILPNGLTYYIYPNAKPENKASIHLVVGAGSLQEEDDQLGLAHFLEHMAFNGTTNYPENDLVRYLQSTGMKFGADLNAHTGFGETVYKLQVSTDKPREFERAFEILKEWAGEITFLPKDVEEEINVILEEWRLRQGLTQRLSDAQKRAVFGDSRYTERFPIGDPDIIRGATPELLKRYYEKWYVPENIAVIAVGDFDSAMVREYIEKYFNYEGRRAPKKKEYRLGRGRGEVYVFTDPEITQSMFDIIIKSDREVITGKSQYREYLTQMLFTGILENRFSWESKGADPKFREGYSYNFPLGRWNEIQIIGGLLREDDMESGIYEIQRFLKTMAYYDVSERELSGEKANLYKNLESMKINRGSMESEKFTNEIKRFHLEGEVFAEVDYQFEVFKELIQGIGVEDIRRYARNLYESGNVDYFLSSPEGNGVKVPDRERVGAIIDEVKNEAARKYELDLDNVELEIPRIETGRIVNTEDEVYNRRYILENGVEVIVKETDFDEDKIFVKFFMDGGSSQLDYDEFTATKFIDVITASGVGNLNSISQDVYLKDKNLTIKPYIRDYNHGVDIRTVRKDFETAMAMNYLLLTQPKVDGVIYNNKVELQREEIRNRGNSPRLVYSDRIDEIVSGGHPRRKPLTLVEVDSLTGEMVLESFRKTYGNFQRAKVLIVGSTQGLPLEEIIERYVGSLPSEEPPQSSADLGIDLPKGITDEDVVKGVDKKTAVTLIYPYRDEYRYEDRVLYLASAQVLNDIMLEDVRERIGGVYSIRSSATLTPLTKGENHLVIRFTTDPSRREEVTQAVKRSVEKLIKGDYPERMIRNTAENYNFNYNGMLRKNDFWMSFLYRREAYGDSHDILTPEEYRELVSRRNLEKFVRNAVNKDNYIEVNLIPEREE